MNLEAIISEVKEFAVECVWKNGEECIKASDSVIENYLRTLMYPESFDFFLRHKETMLKIFRETAENELDFLNDKP
jgi:hypothetical protein